MSIMSKIQPEQDIWETRETAGWKLKLAKLDHLPVEMVQEAGGLHFFLGSDQSAHLLDFRNDKLLLDGEIDGMTPPQPIAIAYHMLRYWLEPEKE